MHIVAGRHGSRVRLEPLPQLSRVHHAPAGAVRVRGHGRQRRARCGGRLRRLRRPRVVHADGPSRANVERSRGTHQRAVLQSVDDACRPRQLLVGQDRAHVGRLRRQGRPRGLFAQLRWQVLSHNYTLFYSILFFITLLST